MRKYVNLFIVCFFWCSYSLAQDIHFSASDYSPLTLNPGLAGINYDLTANINYRSQWGAVASPYQTFGASADVKLTGREHNSKGSLAVGINFFNDQAGDIKITSNRVGLTVAYRIKLVKYHYLSLGVQGSFGTRSIEYSNARWGNQFDGLYYDSNIPGESIGIPDFNYFDVNSGLVYTYRPKNVSNNNEGTILNVGVAAYHLNRPKWSFLQNNSDRLNMRISSFAMAKIGLGNKKMAIEPQIMAQFQGPQMEFIFRY